MKVGDLVRMDYSDWPQGDEWGVGLVIEIDKENKNIFLRIPDGLLDI